MAVAGGARRPNGSPPARRGGAGPCWVRTASGTAGSAGHERSRPVRPTAAQASFPARTRAAARRRRVRIPPPAAQSSMTPSLNLAVGRAGHQAARCPCAPLPWLICKPGAGGRCGQRNGRHNAGDTDSWRGPPLAGCPPPFPAGDVWLTWKRLSTGRRTDSAPVPPPDCPPCTATLASPADKTRHVRAVERPTGRGKVGATRGRRTEVAIPCNPLRSPLSGGALEARMLTSQESPVLIIGGLTHFAWLWVSVACGWNGPDVRRPLPS